MARIESNMLYTARVGEDRKDYVDGPTGSGHGLGYNSGWLFPEYRLSNKADAEAAARIAQVAYNAGYEKAQSDMRKALGMK